MKKYEISNQTDLDLNGCSVAVKLFILCEPRFIPQ